MPTSEKKTLVIFAHPYLEYSHSNRELINFYERHQHFTFRDLYEEYPDFHIAAFRERKRITDYERIIFHFPLIWYGMPPLLRLWIDEVFDRHWLLNLDENPLKGKDIFILVTTNGKETDYQKDGKFGYTIEDLISGLIVSLNVFSANIKTIKKVYEVEKISKKEIIGHKLDFVQHLNS